MPHHVYTCKEESAMGCNSMWCNPEQTAFASQTDIPSMEQMFAFDLIDLCITVGAGLFE